MVFKDDLPLYSTDKEGLKYLLSIAAPLYKIPGRNKIITSIEAKYQALSAVVRKKLEKANWLTITSDMWTETMTTRSFVGYTLHFLDDERLLSITLNIFEFKEQHQSDKIEESFDKMLEKWNIVKNKVTAVVTNNASDIVKAVNETFGKNKHVRCFAHCLNLVVSKALTDTADLQTLIDKVKAIVTYFRQSTSAAAELRKSQDPGNFLRLTQDVSIRWNSTYDMAERFVALIDAVSSVLLKRLKARPMINAEAVAQLKEIITILQPLKIVTTELCGEQYVTSSRVIPAVHCLHRALTEIKTELTMGSALKGNIINELERRFKDNIDTPLLFIPTLLDPRFKELYFPDAASESRAIRAVQNLIRNIQKTQSVGESVDNPMDGKNTIAHQIWKHHNEIVQHRRKYRDNAPCLSGGIDANLKLYLAIDPKGLKTDVIQFWLSQKEDKPVLKSISLK